MLIILAMTRAFRQYPTCRGPLDHSGLGSGHATTRARAILLLAIYGLQWVTVKIGIQFRPCLFRLYLDRV